MENRAVAQTPAIPDVDFELRRSTTKCHGQDDVTGGTGTQPVEIAPEIERDTTMGFRVIITTGLATLYLAGCLAALSLLLSMWSPFV